MEVELVIGRREDLADDFTELRWLNSVIRGRGCRLRRVVRVYGSDDAYRGALHEACSRGGLVITTGGVAKGVTVPAAVLQLIGSELPEESFPSGTRGHPFSRRALRRLDVDGREAGFGTVVLGASLVVLSNDRELFRAGVQKHVDPLLAMAGQPPLRSAEFRCAGLSDEQCDALLASFSAPGVDFRRTRVAAEVWVRVEEGAAGPEFDRVVAGLSRAFGIQCYSSTGESLASVVGRLCATRGVRLAVAESCTGGLIGAAITQVSGSSAYFLGGAITYSNDEKSRALGVRAEILSAHGAVSEPVALAMAEGIRARTGATHSLAVTGIAGPEGGSPMKPVGTVWLALSREGCSYAVRHVFSPTSRDSVREASVSAALDMLRRDLLGVR